jgi:aminocarboxymuconate-semialdehyde decarboxylase
MLYTCDSSLKPMAVSGRKHRPSSRHSTFAVDVHCHVYVPEAAELVKDAFDPTMDDLFKFTNEATREVNAAQVDTIMEPLTSLERRIADMDVMGIDVQAVSPAPLQYYYSLDVDLAVESSRLINNHIASMCEAEPDRIVGLANVPLQSPEHAIAELERVMKDLNFRGVEISTNVAGKELSDRSYWPFFKRAEELGALVFMHPCGFSEGRRLTDHYFTNVIGNPLDTSIAVQHMIFSGLLEECSKLKVCLAHGGGYLAAYSGRIDHAHSARKDCRRFINKPPTSYLKQLYFDTIVFTQHQLEYLVSIYGADHLVIGTDYPYDMGMYEPVDFVNSANLTDQQKEMIIGLNAAQLLGIEIK